MTREEKWCRRGIKGMVMLERTISIMESMKVLLQRIVERVID